MHKGQKNRVKEQPKKLLETLGIVGPRPFAWNETLKQERLTQQHYNSDGEIKVQGNVQLIKSQKYRKYYK